MVLAPFVGCLMVCADMCAMVLSCCSQVSIESHIRDNYNQALEDNTPEYDNDDTCNAHDDDNSYNLKLSNQQHML
jgi:hypothetical protein